MLNAVSRPGSILKQSDPLANREELCLLLNDLGHVALAQVLNGNRSAWRGVVRSGRIGGELALKALGHYRPSRALIAVDYIAKTAR